MSEWVEIIEPRTHEHMFANLSTGECLWDPPLGVPVKKTSSDQWWELFDPSTARFYYYNASSQSTVWQRPPHCDIIPLAKIQTLKQNTLVQKTKLKDQITASNSQGEHANANANANANTAASSKRDSNTQTKNGRLQPEEEKNKEEESTEESKRRNSSSSLLLLRSSLTQTLPSEEASPTRKRRSHHHSHSHHHPPSARSLTGGNSALASSRRRATLSGGGDNASSNLAKQRSLEVIQGLSSSPSKRSHARKLNHVTSSSHNPSGGNAGASSSSISRSVSFVSRPDAWKSNTGRRSMESTPTSSRRRSAEGPKAPPAAPLPHSSITTTTSSSSSQNGAKIMTPLQKYILDQAKLSGYRFGDPVSGEDRDSYVESEDDHRHNNDDSDDFADDEEAEGESSSASSSSGEEDDYLSEPTYHNVGPSWNACDTDAFSEEFDQRMRLGGRLSAYNPAPQIVSTMPRPLSSAPAIPTPSAYPVPYDVASLQRRSLRTAPQAPSSHQHSQQQQHQTQPGINPTSSSLSVSTSIHSTISCESDIEKYAQDNMNIQKRGLFRRKMTVKDILSWAPEGISKPLTCLSEKGAKKEAIETFKLIQIYMGDRKAKAGMTINSVALDISTSGYLKTPLRDEIFVQLCKQTTENPRKESLRRGWELLAICLAFFPPSSAFSHCLSNYIGRHRDPALDDFPDLGKWPIHVQISHFAGICAKRLERIGEGGYLVPKKPSVEDIDQSRLQIFRPSMFGGTLEETLEMQRERFPDKKIPWILTTLASQIITLNGTGTEGIFRVPADMEEVNSLKSRFDQWEVPLCGDSHTAASLLKLWFRELYEPIIPSFLYEEAVSNPEDPAFVLSLINRRLPESHLSVLAFLIRFLQVFDRAEVIFLTKMDSSNMSTVFAPNVLRCPSMDPNVILENARKEMAFVKTLITHYHTPKEDEDPV